MAVFIDGYEIDVFTDEAHTFDSRITSDPVEDGADITDNIQELPDSITLTGIVSDTPFGQLAERRAPSEINSMIALNILKQVRSAREPVTIETNLDVYEDMALERLSVPQNAQTGDALQFTATFRKVRIVQTERSTVRVKLPRNGRKTKLGKSTRKFVTDTGHQVGDLLRRLAP